MNQRLLAFSDPPYAEWSDSRKLHTQVTRLDGPGLFSHGGLVFAVARAQPGARSGLTQLGSLFARKRTALWWIDPGREAPAGGSGEPRLVWLSDLPSAGDTSYAGVVLNPILRPTVRSPRARRIRKISAATR